ncbi:hypothetical protein Ciccas_010323 [Cichlidogyrus casuarinus]|uniref:Uncharacterized protein n=1 Tax=Cichlidogyrus casuarinus TaxID=1844966 RepID=A0ABD2PVM8_9PLAT
MKFVQMAFWLSMSDATNILAVEFFSALPLVLLDLPKSLQDELLLLPELESLELLCIPFESSF